MTVTYEPLVEGLVYRIDDGHGNREYRMLRGAMGTEVPSITLPEGYKAEIVEDSDFLDPIEFREWAIRVSSRYPGLIEFRVHRDSRKWLIAEL